MTATRMVLASFEHARVVKRLALNREAQEFWRSPNIRGVKRFLIGSTLLFGLAACGDSSDVVPAAQAQPLAAVAASEPEVQSPEPEPDDDVKAMEAALLGMNKKPVVEEEPVAKPTRHRRRVRRAIVDDEPIDDEPVIPSGISSAEFHAVVSGFKGLKPCLAQNAAFMESRSGVLRVKFAVRADGRPESVKVVETKGEAAERIQDCVARRAKRLSFPEFAGEPVEHIAKFVF